MAVVGLMHFVPSPAFGDDRPHSEVPAGNAAYPVTDSGVWGDALHDPKIFWIDNHRVLFKNAEFQNKGEALRGRFKIAVWDTRTNKVTPYTDYAEKLRLCYADGYLSYVLYDDKFVRNYAEQLAKGRIRYFAGPFGKEERLAVPASRSPKLNEFSCRFITDLNHPIYDAKSWGLQFLKESHGYLDFGSWRAGRLGDETPKVKYYRTKKNGPIELPIDQSSLLYVSFYEFAQAYRVGLMPGRRNQGSAPRSWWLYPDGKVEVAPMGILPTRAGPLQIRVETVRIKGRTGFRSEPGNSGVFLTDESQGHVKLLGGYFRGVRVAPDGCKVAFIHYEHPDAENADDPRPITLKSIALCRERGRAQ
jgi:hypothetical protein